MAAFFGDTETLYCTAHTPDRPLLPTMTLLPLRSTAVFLLAAVWAHAALAQAQIWRCGNEYTNNPGNAEARGCRVVEGGNITIVEGTRPNPPASGAAASGRPAGNGTGAGNAGNAGGAGNGNASGGGSGARNPGERVNAAEQRARDSDARQILETELRRAEERLADLREEYNNGQPEKIGIESRNFQRYLDRVADIKARMDRAESDVAAIRREMARLAPPVTPAPPR
jgi:hypothetical protein